jgi:hypothetical protein
MSSRSTDSYTGFDRYRCIIESSYRASSNGRRGHSPPVCALSGQLRRKAYRTPADLASRFAPCRESFATFPHRQSAAFRPLWQGCRGRARRRPPPWPLLRRRCSVTLGDFKDPCIRRPEARVCSVRRSTHSKAAFSLDPSRFFYVTEAAGAKPSSSGLTVHMMLAGAARPYSKPPPAPGSRRLTPRRTPLATGVCTALKRRCTDGSPPGRYGLNARKSLKVSSATGPSWPDHGNSPNTTSWAILFESSQAAGPSCKRGTASAARPQPAPSSAMSPCAAAITWGSPPC